MARILGFVFIAVAGFVAAKLLNDARPGAKGDAYRARRGARMAGVPEPGTHVEISRAALSQVRDALTGAPLDADDELFRCAQCQSFYSVASVRALADDNAARCVSCGSTHRISVNVTP